MGSRRPAALRRRERHRIVVEALVLDLAVLDLVDCDLAQRHLAPVAQLHGGIPLDADRLRPDPDVRRLPGCPRLHLLPVLELLLEPVESESDLPGRFVRRAVFGVEGAEIGGREVWLLRHAHDLARERLETRCSCRRPGGAPPLRGAPLWTDALLRASPLPWHRISSGYECARNHTPRAPRTRWPAHGGA